MGSEKKDINGRDYYINLVDPFITFNREEITLAHLFREKTKILQNRNYATCLYQYLFNKGFIRDEVVEIGCGLGDLAAGILMQDKKRVKKYFLYDLSEKLHETQRKKLIDFKRNIEYINDDCLVLSDYFDDFNGLFLSNGMIADLRSVYLSPNDKLEQYEIFDDELLDFVNEFEISQSKTGWFLHVGTLLFLRQIAKSLSSHGNAVITEYGATRLNQPSYFVSHYECGIDFNQISSYATRLGFDTEIIEMEDVLSISKEERFLSVDAFTSQDRLAKRIPISVKLWQAKNNLPVLAYTQATLEEMLVSDFMGLSSIEASKIVKGLESCFHSLSDPKFDHINPTTWSYQCLLLKKRKNNDWKSVIQQDVISLIKEIDDVSEEDATAGWNKAINDFENKKLGHPDIMDLSLGLAIVVPIAYNAYVKYGIAWKHFAEQELLLKFRKMCPDNTDLLKKIIYFFNQDKTKKS